MQDIDRVQSETHSSASAPGEEGCFGRYALPRKADCGSRTDRALVRKILAILLINMTVPTITPVSAAEYGWHKSTRGSCGPSAGQTVSSTPTMNLYSVKAASVFSSAGPWMWVCSSRNDDGPSHYSATIQVTTERPVEEGLCTGATRLGTYVGFPNNADASGQAAFASNWAGFVSAMGHSPTVWNTYIDETIPFSGWVKQTMEWQVPSVERSNPPVLAKVTPVIGWPMAIEGHNADMDLKEIAAGVWDSVFTQVFQSWVKAGYTAFYIRPGYEMNVRLVNSNNAADFVAAFRHIYMLAHKFTGAAITVVWNPNEGGNGVPYNSFYPGDTYVDVIGLDIYGRPNNPSTLPDLVPSDPTDFTLKTAIAFAKAHRKPFALPETGGGGDAIFPTNLARVITESRVPIAFINIWDATEGGALRWDQNSIISAAWRAAFSAISRASMVVCR